MYILPRDKSKLALIYSASHHNIHSTSWYFRNNLVDCSATRYRSNILNCSTFIAFGNKDHRGGIDSMIHLIIVKEIHNSCNNILLNSIPRLLVELCSKPFNDMCFYVPNIHNCMNNFRLSHKNLKPSSLINRQMRTHPHNNNVYWLTKISDSILNPNLLLP